MAYTLGDKMQIFFKVVTHEHKAVPVVEVTGQYQAAQGLLMALSAGKEVKRFISELAISLLERSGEETELPSWREYYVVERNGIVFIDNEFFSMMKNDWCAFEMDGHKLLNAVILWSWFTESFDEVRQFKFELM